MVKTETVGKTDTPTEPSKTPQTIVQNDITKDQVEKIKRRKRN
jgi:Ca-activated chloride channel family protein